MLDLLQTNSCRDLGRLYFYPAWGKMSSVKKVVRFMVGFLLFGSAIFPAQAAFTNLYIFGDGACTTTNNPVAGPQYYGLRRSNGRVWVEVLAQEQGLTNNYWYSNNILNHVSYTNLSASSTNWYYSSNNWSYYGQYSSNLVNNLTHFTAPPGASNALFVVWVNDADFVGDMGNIYPNFGTNISKWTNAINQSLTNHWKVITNLYYAKGARTLIMPNAVDITEIPQFNGNPSADKYFIRQRIIAFNVAFTTILNQAITSLPGITIYEPDFFTLLDNVVTNAAFYGLTNALDGNGQSTDVIEDDALANKSLNGPGTNYIFWDATDPSAKFHSLIAGVAQQLISPVQITNLTALNGSNQLVMANVPIGQNGLVLGRPNLVLGNWATNATFVSSNATQSVFVTPSGPQWFYRLKFPYTWAWP
jgi:phospholipase/lecithinase/hemolysin